MVRELLKHQSVYCLIVAFVIARFMSLSCYSSAKTRIQPVKSYQINESFLLNNPLCIAVPCVLFNCCFEAFSMSGAPSLPVEFAMLLLIRPEPTFELHFRFFNRIFPSRFCTQYYCTHISDLQERASPI